MPNCNVKNFKKSNLGNFGPLVKHGPHWINFTILTFISENSRYFKCLYKVWNEIISFDMKKRVKCKTCHGKSEEGEFGSPWSGFPRLKKGTPIMLGPIHNLYITYIAYI